MPAIDRKTIEDLKAQSGAEFLAELIDTFLADAPIMMGQLKSALAAGDPDSFRLAAHSLKSNAATFGAQDLATLARELEGMARANDLAVAGRLEALETALADASAELKALRT